MASNPYVNKVEFAGQTVMDISGDTATPSDVLNGVTFHDRSGAPQTGNLITHNVYDGLDSTSASDALSANQGKVLNSKIANLNSDENTTTDILASALAATRTTFFKGSGSGYIGNIPAQSALNYGSFIVNVRNAYRYVIGVNTEGKVFTNVYLAVAGGGSWYGWHELALKSDIDNITPGTSFTTLVNERLTYTTTNSYLNKAFTLQKASVVVATQNYNGAYPKTLSINSSSSSSQLGYRLAQAAEVNGAILVNAVLPAGTYYLWGSANSEGGNDTVVKACPI